MRVFCCVYEPSQLLQQLLCCFPLKPRPASAPSCTSCRVRLISRVLLSRTSVASRASSRRLETLTSSQALHHRGFSSGFSLPAVHRLFEEETPRDDLWIPYAACWLFHEAALLSLTKGDLYSAPGSGSWRATQTSRWCGTRASRHKIHGSRSHSPLHITTLRWLGLFSLSYLPLPTTPHASSPMNPSTHFCLLSVHRPLLPRACNSCSDGAPEAASQLTRVSHTRRQRPLCERDQGRW